MVKFGTGDAHKTSLSGYELRSNRSYDSYTLLRVVIEFPSLISVIFRSG
jgi:hypothetical protein